MSDSVRPHRRQPTRLPRLWDSPGKNTGVGCHSFSNAWKWKVKMKSLSRVWLLATSWIAVYQAPLSMGFSRQEYWNGVPLPSPIINNKDFQILRCDKEWWIMKHKLWNSRDLKPSGLDWNIYYQGDRGNLL